MALVATQALSFFTISIAGHLSDLIGRKRMYIIGSVATAMFGFVYFLILPSRLRLPQKENAPSKTNHDVRPPALIGAAEKGLDPQARLYDAGKSASMRRSLSTRNFRSRRTAVLFSYTGTARTFFA
jgi:MFS family permease